MKILTKIQFEKEICTNYFFLIFLLKLFNREFVMIFKMFYVMIFMMIFFTN